MVIYKLPQCHIVEALPKNCALALGNFDGVHKGHQKLFEFAGEGGCKNVAWTFTSLAKPGVTVPFLTDMKAKLELFSIYGLDYAVFEDFEAVRSMEYGEFATKYLIDNFAPKRVVCGFNFRFGRGGAGDAEKLRSLLAPLGVEVGIIQPVLYHGKTVSSSAIRAAVELGDMEEASMLLGHHFSVNTPVVEGKHLGRTWGFPTINQEFSEGCIVPRRGIYATTAYIDGEKYISVSNVGVRPTVDKEGSRVNCETHIIGYEGELYGREIKVDFHLYLRDEMRFSSAEELTAQIKNDIESAKAFFDDSFVG